MNKIYRQEIKVQALPAEKVYGDCMVGKKGDVSKNTEEDSLFSTKEYAETLAELKKRIQEGQLKAITSVNKELIRLYWTIGKIIIERQEGSGWGSKFIDKITKDLQNAFPRIEGFSRANIFRMRAFHLKYRIVAPLVRQFDELEDLKILSQISWSHNIILMESLEEIEDRLWYARKSIECGWSRRTLASWIKSRLHEREGKAITNFTATLPSPQSDMAQQVLKDPYLFDFLTLKEDYEERDLEDGLVNHIQKFLIELGQGFAFMGRQYQVVVEGDSYYIDLLFFHVKLRAFVVIEIKARPFKPEDAGQLNFYLSAIDDKVKHPTDNPTIGILLCKSRNKVKAEYAFRHINRPMAAVEYETMLTKSIPEEMRSGLPTIQEIEAELEIGDIATKDSSLRKEEK